MSRETPHQILGVVSAIMGLILTAGCGPIPPTHPTAPPPEPVVLGPKPNVAGVWRGEVTVADCWRVQGVGPDPCDARRGRTEPLVLDISHIDTLVPDVDLRIAVVAFVPAAEGICYGTRDATGAIFFQGLLRRTADHFDVLVTFRGQLDGNRIYSLDEMIDVNVTLGNSVSSQLLGERWIVSPIHRQ